LKNSGKPSRPIFEKLGRKVFHVGPDDQVRYLNLLVNMMVGITSAMTAEAGGSDAP